MAGRQRNEPSTRVTSGKSDPAAIVGRGVLRRAFLVAFIILTAVLLIGTFFHVPLNAQQRILIAVDVAMLSYIMYPVDERLDLKTLGVAGYLTGYSALVAGFVFLLNYSFPQQRIDVFIMPSELQSSSAAKIDKWVGARPDNFKLVYDADRNLHCVIVWTSGKSKSYRFAMSTTAGSAYEVLLDMADDDGGGERYAVLTSTIQR